MAPFELLDVVRMRHTIERMTKEILDFHPNTPNRMTLLSQLNCEVIRAVAPGEEVGYAKFMHHAICVALSGPPGASLQKMREVVLRLREAVKEAGESDEAVTALDKLIATIETQTP